MNDITQLRSATTETPEQRDAAMDGQGSSELFRRMRWRLLPFLVVLYIVSFLDRVNVSFAKLTMNADLGFDDSLYALGAGIFFIGYFLFEVPSNLIMTKTGARRWIARIMITWGLISAGTAFVTDASSFLWLRFALGVAEAGFFPGILLYLTHWFPAAERARVVGLFMVAVPICGLIGSPLSSELMKLDGWLGLHGWQWLFVIEGLPATFLGIACLALLPDGPDQAKWLTVQERSWLAGVLAAERADVERQGHSSLRAAFTQPFVWALAFIYFGIVLGLYGLGFWLPTLVSGFGIDLTQVGWLTALPFGCSAAFMVWWSRRSDAKQERIWHAAVSVVIGFAGFAAASQAESNAAQLLCLCFAAMGIYGAIPIFWTLPNLCLTGAAAAAGIAVINSIGNLAGYLGPQIVAWLTGEDGDFSAALLSLGGAMLLSAGALVLLRARLSHAR